MLIGDVTINREAERVASMAVGLTAPPPTAHNEGVIEGVETFNQFLSENAKLPSEFLFWIKGGLSQCEVEQTVEWSMESEKP